MNAEVTKLKIRFVRFSLYMAVLFLLVYLTHCVFLFGFSSFGLFLGGMPKNKPVPRPSSRLSLFAGLVFMVSNMILFIIFLEQFPNEVLWAFSGKFASSPLLMGLLWISFQSCIVGAYASQRDKLQRSELHPSPSAEPNLA